MQLKHPLYMQHEMLHYQIQIYQFYQNAVFQKLELPFQ